MCDPTNAGQRYSVEGGNRQDREQPDRDIHRSNLHSGPSSLVKAHSVAPLVKPIQEGRRMSWVLQVYCGGY